MSDKVHLVQGDSFLGRAITALVEQQIREDRLFKAPGPPPTQEEGRAALHARLMLYKLFKNGGVR